MKALNKYITDYLDYYLSLKVKPGYAILIRGKWGCGKSWLMKDYMDSHKEYGYLYVSLNGMTSYKEIEDSFFEQIHPVLASKGMKIAGKIIKGLIKTTIKVDFDRDGKEDASVTSGVPDINLPDYLKNIDNKVLIFDDLERCAIPIPNILGYINQFVETHGLKVVIIANEEEIIKANAKDIEGNEPKSYLLIKEKLIGKSFDVTTDFESAIDDFITESNNSEVSKLISTNRGLVKELFETAGYDNLRHLRQTILDLDRFYSFLPEKAKSKSELIGDIISLFFSISFELRKGKIHEGDISRLFLIDYFGSKNDNEKSITQKIREKYSIFGKYYYPINADLWVEFFKYGFIKKEDVELSIKNSYYFQDERTPNWIKLWHYFDMNDDDFEKSFQKVFSELESKNISDKYEIVQVVGLFISFCNINLIPYKKKRIVKLGRESFKKLKAEKKLKLAKYEEFPSNVSHGLGYMGLKDPDFIEFLSYATKLVNSSQEEDYPSLAIELLNKLEKSQHEFEEAVVISNSRNNLYYNVPILKYIPLDKFMAVFLKLDNKEKKQLAWTFEKRYEHSEFHQNLKDEIDWLKKLQVELEKEQKKHVRKVSSKIIEFTFLKSLDKVIAALTK
jgi:hypothetical protein